MLKFPQPNPQNNRPKTLRFYVVMVMLLFSLQKKRIFTVTDKRSIQLESNKEYPLNIRFLGKRKFIPPRINISIPFLSPPKISTSLLKWIQHYRFNFLSFLPQTYFRLLFAYIKTPRRGKMLLFQKFAFQ